MSRSARTPAALSGLPRFAFLAPALGLAALALAALALAACAPVPTDAPGPSGTPAARAPASGLYGQARELAIPKLENLAPAPRVIGASRQLGRIERIVPDAGGRVLAVLAADQEQQEFGFARPREGALTLVSTESGDILAQPVLRAPVSIVVPTGAAGEFDAVVLGMLGATVHRIDGSAGVTRREFTKKYMATGANVSGNGQRGVDAGGVVDFQAGKLLDFGRKLDKSGVDDTGCGKAAISPDGSYVACAHRFIAPRSTQHFVEIWDASRRALLKRLPVSSAAEGFAFSADSQRLAVLRDETITVYRTRDAGVAFQARTGHALELALSPSGDELAFRLNESGRVRLMSTTGRGRRDVPLPSNASVTALAYAATGDLYIGTEKSGLFRLPAGAPAVSALLKDADQYALSADGTLAARLSPEEGRLCLFETTALAVRWCRTEARLKGSATLLVPTDGSTVGVSADNQVLLFEASRGAPLATLPHDGGFVDQVRILDGGAGVVSANGQQILVRSRESGSVRTIETRCPAISALQVYRNTYVAAACMSQGVVWVYRLSDLQPVLAAEAPLNTWRIFFSPAGDHIAMTGRDQAGTMLCTSDLRGQTRRCNIDARSTTSFSTVAYAPDASYLAWHLDGKLMILAGDGPVEAIAPQQAVPATALPAGRPQSLLYPRKLLGSFAHPGRSSGAVIANEGVVRLASDGGIAVFKLNEGRQLGSMSVRQDFVFAQTTSGFFYTDPGMPGEVIVEVENQRVGVKEFWDVFYRPDLVRAMLQGQSDRRVGMASLKEAISAPPPKVTLAPVEGPSDQRRLRIRFSVASRGGGIAEIRVFQNGKLVHSDGSYRDAVGRTYAPVDGNTAAATAFADGRNATLFAVPASGAASAAGTPEPLRDQLFARRAEEKKCDPCTGEIPLDVIPGEENTVTVVAFNRDNTIQSQPANLSFRSTLPREEPQLWILGVGVNEFRKFDTRQIGSLVNARKDAQDFLCAYAGKAALQEAALPCSDEGRARTLFKPQHVHVVGALLDARATKAAILQGLEKVAARARPGDTFVWFVASHGLMDANGLFGIVAHDTKCLTGDCTQVQDHITSNEILEASKKIKAMRQLVVLDTCHAGGLDHKLSGLYDARVSLLARNMGLHLYASAQATEQAQDGRPGTNGVFTAQLLEGLRGAAPRTAQGQISVMTLGPWARQRTLEATRSAQSPVIQHFGQDAPLAAGR